MPERQLLNLYVHLNIYPMYACRMQTIYIVFFSVRVYMMLNDITYINVLFEEGCVADVFNLNITSQNNIATPRLLGPAFKLGNHIPLPVMFLCVMRAMEAA